MLKLTRKVEYALISIRYMQTKKPGVVSSAKEMAELYDIPQELLAKTLQLMARGGLVQAVQGPAGGYKIKAPLEEINMVEFFEKIEGPLGMMDCYFDTDCNQITNCNIRTPIRRINDNLRSMFENMTVYDITH